mmetsp:Transcript_4386/g.8436  ORF Transcript_4386/g.8436 Transcript_4386/m.8436 type:complete len:283 (+) Transcript_4386:381-1229(+)|eukprot:CAMPEP_0176486598 /NCGR_PEP_ID=MMETSP0200_2-20121128/5655_1 /TAXON_ID=947934 /ORGANISM="Chaetoceros sp., Strain GSL56" /LENGTH=282 /DNA_ID=CAMNT_0017883313 /DNA_START=137 /DNA_END=985 /DNA_ORIENTATION=+
MHGRKYAKKICFLAIILLQLLFFSFEKESYSLLFDKWTEQQIVSFLESNPNRAHFSRLFRLGGFRKGIEVGVADGRFSEHILRDNRFISGFEWTLIEPYPNDELNNRFNAKTSKGTWVTDGLLNNLKLIFHNNFSMDEVLEDLLPLEEYDFIYLDGDHSYQGVKNEIPFYWRRVKKCGVLAGHDYCNHGEQSLVCNGCDNVPTCQNYTEFGMANGKGSGMVKNQNGVVKAVQEWIVTNNDSRITLHHTLEDFTRESLLSSGMDYDLIITSTRNPSWYVVKPC